MDWSKGILEFLKLTPKNVLPLTIISSFFLFAPKSWLNTLSILEIQQEYQITIGLVFLFSIAILITHLIFGFLNKVKNIWFKRQVKLIIIKQLHQLTEDEKQILRYYIAENTRANTLRYDDGIVKGLEKNFIIYRSSNLGNMVEGFPYNISDIAWDYLHENYNLLEGSTNTYRTDKRHSWWN